MVAPERVDSRSAPGDVVPSPACCLLHQPVAPAVAGPAGGGASRREQVRQITALSLIVTCPSSLLIGLKHIWDRITADLHITAPARNV